MRTTLAILLLLPAFLLATARAAQGDMPRAGAPNALARE